MMPRPLHTPLYTWNRILVLALTFMLLVWVDMTVVTHAEDAVAPVTPPHPQHPKLTIEDRVKRLTATLALTTPQQAEVRGILTRRQSALERLRADTALSAVDRVHRYNAVDQRTIDQIKGVLTEEQRQKYAPTHPLPPESILETPSAQGPPPGESTP
jgi:hypothetical protein